MSIKPKVLIAVAVTGFAVLTAYAITNAHYQDQLHLKDIQVQSTRSELLELKTDYEEVNQRLEAELEKDELNKKELDKIRKERKQLQDRLERTEAELHAKRRRQSEEQQRLARVAQTTLQTQASVAPVQAQRSGGCDIVNNYAWDTRVAYAVCMAESGGNPMAANMNDRHNGCVGSFGLMQIACLHGGQFYDPKQNMDKAFEIYSRSAWQPWGAYTSGAYLRYI